MPVFWHHFLRPPFPKKGGFYYLSNPPKGSPQVKKTVKKGDIVYGKITKNQTPWTPWIKRGLKLPKNDKKCDKKLYFQGV